MAIVWGIITTASDSQRSTGYVQELAEVLRLDASLGSLFVNSIKVVRVRRYLMLF